MVLQSKVALMQQKGPGQLDMVGLVAGWGDQAVLSCSSSNLSVSIFWQFCCVARVYHIYRAL